MSVIDYRIFTMKPFSSDPSNYVRDLDPFAEAKKNYAFYIWKKVKGEGHSYQFVLDWVEKEWVEGGKLGYKQIPTKLVYYNEDKGGDREFLVTTYEAYLKRIRDEKLIVSPSGTALYNQHQKLSPLNKYLSNKKKDRSKYKKLAQKGKMEGDEEAVRLNDPRQKAKKTGINALSGAESLPNNSLYSEPIHPLLTSYCRTGTTHANSVNERFISGNRHYWHPLVVKSNIVSLCQNCDENVVMSVVSKYNLTIPTAEDVMAVIDRCTKPYYHDEAERSNILELVSVLDDYERVFFCYHYDLYTLEKHNTEFVKDLFFTFTRNDKNDVTIEEADEYLKGLDEDASIAVGVFCSDQTRGVQRKDWKEKDIENYKVIGATAKNFNGALERYADLINCFWCNSLLPASIYELPSVRRKCVLGGDTDSTLYSAWYWREKYSPKIFFDDTTRRLASLIIYFSGAITAHVLRQMSKNSGAVDEHLSTLTMKNEFLFPSFLLTGRAKHYTANQEVEEGNFLKEMALEIKGVHLRNSNWPEAVKKNVSKLCDYILRMGCTNQHIDIEAIFNEISIYENMIMKSLEVGDPSYLSSFKITDGTNNSIFVDFWETVFSGKYGSAEGRTIRTLKIPVTNAKPADTKKWMESIKDASIRNGLETFIKRFRKDKFTFMIVPDNIISSSGIPEEIRMIVDKESLFSGSLSGFYLILEALNIFLKDEDFSENSFVSDFYEYDLYNKRILDPEESIRVLGDSENAVFKK